MIDLGEYLEKTHTVLLTQEAYEELLKRARNIEKAKAEIKELRDSWERDCYHDEAEALDTALKIIDKCTEGGINIDLNDMKGMFDNWNPTPEELEEFMNHLSSFSISLRGDQGE